MSKIDEIAKAIALAGNGGTWDDWYNEDQREFHRKRARAAIEAMREPTREMVARAWAESDEGLNDIGVLVCESSTSRAHKGESLKHDTAYEVWQLMIDAALTEGEEG